MPILPENKSRYPKNWKEIREQILERANHACEFCHVENHAIGYRGACGSFFPLEPGFQNLAPGRKPLRIVLTIAHLDHTPENNDPANLKALCQRCHNRYDQAHRKETRARRKR